MKTPQLDTRSLERARAFFWAVCVFLLVLSPFAESPSGYLLVTIPICACAIIWLQSGAGGIPALPIASVLYWIYYALPLLRTPSRNYSPADYAEAGLTVGLFLTSAVLSWGLIFRVRKLGRRRSWDLEAPLVEKRIFGIVCLGLLSGITFMAATFLDGLDVFGNFVGVVRSVSFTFSAVSAFLLGYARGRQWLSGRRWFAATVLFSIYLMLHMFSLYISGAAALLLGAIVAYALASKKVPVITLIALLGLFTVLHAGKGDMRVKYWNPETQEAKAGLASAPEFFVQWVEDGISNFVVGKATGDAALERTSLLQMLLLAQYSTPGLVPFLEGATYSYLGVTLVPRFLNPDKANSQSGLNLMSVHYGLQRAEDTRSTTIAWGLIAEAFANFGHAGVIVMGLFFGVLNGFITRFSTGMSPLSVPFLMAASATLNILNVEADFSYLILNIVQSLISVLIFAMVLRLLQRKRRPAPKPIVDPAHAARGKLARVGLRGGLRPDF